MGVRSGERAGYSTLPLHSIRLARLHRDRPLLHDGSGEVLHLVGSKSLHHQTSLQCVAQHPSVSSMSREDHHQEEYQQLLHSLKGTVEGLLISQVSNVWNVYGGLNRLHNAMEKIFKHGCRVFNHDGDPDCWIFIQGLSWLQPSLAVSPTFLAELEESIPHVPQHASGKAWGWLYRSLEGHALSQKLSWLLSDREHLLSCFEKYAYLCQEKYAEATLICLRAVEQNQPSLLTEIDPCLYLGTWNFKVFHKTHRRYSSFPETQYSIWRNGRNKSVHFKLLKQSSEGSQQKVVTNACSSSAVLASENIERVEREDVAELQDDDFTDDKTLCKENPGSFKSVSDDVSKNIKCRTLQVGSAGVIITDSSVTGDLRSWSSLPDLTGSNSGNTSRERSVTLDVQEFPVSSSSVPQRCSQLSWLRTGSQTLPSSPAKLIHNSAEFSYRKYFPPQHFKGKDLKSQSRNSPAAKSSELSPSVLQIDYSSEVHLETPPSATEQRTFNLQKCNRDWKPIPLRNLSILGTVKRPLRLKDESGVKANQKHATSNCANSEPNTDTSGTLNPETNKPTDESQPSIVMIGPELDRPSIRPSDLKLSVQPWDEADGLCIETQDSSCAIIGKEKQDENPRRKKTMVVGSAPEYAGEWLSDETVDHKSGHLKLQKKSFIESGGGGVLPMAIGFFPRPTEGQSLTSFLSSGQFSRPSAELDRENAHFSICEAMIAAIEQVKCNHQLSVAEETGEVGDESDEEINHLKQRIRMRRRQRQEEKQRHLMPVSLLSDGKTDTTTTDQSVSPLSSSSGTPSESVSTDDVDDLEVDEVKNLAQLKNAGTDVALTESVVSAEGVALSLLRRFSEKHLPRASDLEWLVSEQDAPQQLLPLPTSWPVSPDEAEDLDMHQATPLRGTTEWAPPRSQVIFTPHSPPVRRVLMVKQNYRCAGCGMKVAPEYANRFRYCEYLGRYFCTGCHTNQLALIPGKVLTKWDFTRYSVSSFSYRLLDQMFGDPLFAIGDVSPSLYRKARQLERTRQLRMQLYYLKDFVLTCRFADNLQEALCKEPEYMLTELDMYSMQDLVQVKSGEMTTRLREIVSKSSQHVADCQLCQARGFVCELCPSQEVIFPWQLGKVARCPTCGACFHIACWSPSPCPRCTRLSARRQSRVSDKNADIQAV
ncbi:run domain Beclin-1-interacting and cysteine-rich domain-containing protein isoform X3 [Cryptotermes secundus]|uniref:run domain Beclin-1-interacting and cysteine-rich domain-containing protein isoform X3 n=1 Tax=Cryptotermes secundus TaxID=105785 RepID=UPI000CD7CA78|nr:run domain Beclin-1-interacting and cysteine-rich domain-containing protein isoform X3 [Cryptotermes secundus]